MPSLAFVVTTAPTSQNTATAINIVKAAVQNDIDVIGVFFYQQGVLNAAKNLAIPNDEYQTKQHWLQLASEFNIPLHLCITAAEKRGLTDEVDDSIEQAFTVSGLGELVALSSQAERVIQL